MLANRSVAPTGREILALKIVANAGAYGIFAEFNRRELPNGVTEEIVLNRPDGTRVRCHVAAPEEPGEFAFPPIAASVTAAARLMLALTERLVRNAHGEYAFGDTDSMAIVATKTGGLVRAWVGPNDFRTVVTRSGLCLGIKST